MKNGVFLCTCSGTNKIDFKKLRNSINSDAVEVHEILCQEPGKIKEVFERKELSRGLVACTLKKEVFEALDLDITFVNLREHCGWVHNREDATGKAVALVQAALNSPEAARKKIIDPGRDVLIIGPASPSIRIAQHMHKSANIMILITDTGDSGAMMHKGFEILSGSVKDIEGSVGNFRLNIISNPLSPDKCIECGKCIDVCPVNALNRYPIFAVNEKCDMCGKCSGACPTKAIDLEENITILKAGQVLAIGKNAIYPEGKKGFYITSEGKDIEGTVGLALSVAVEIIANTAGLEIDAPVKAMLEGCASGKSGFRGCTLCERACRHGAINRSGDNIAFDERSCTGCGACASICPLSLFRMEDDIYSRMEYLLSPSNFKRNKIERKILMFTCAHSIPFLDALGGQKKKYPPVLPLFVTDLSQVSETHLLRAFDLGADGVIMLGCNECAGHVSEEVCRFAGWILDEFKLSNRIRVIRNISGTKDFMESLLSFNEHLTSNRLGVHKPVKLNNASKRMIFLDLVASFAAKTGITPSSVIEDAIVPFADISIGASCTVCGACTSMCPVGALMREEGSITFRYGYCITCGMCEQACPEKTLTMRHVLDMAKLLDTVPSTLFKSELQVCASCRKPYMTRAAFDRISNSFIENVRDDLEPLEQVELIKNQTELLKYCENCRPARSILKMEMLT
jgi:heterodisulfide reductase subunit A-like polyferredoxin/coenzyme F420-reducing hydrogenase delta subunit